jgi:hypothetical protein
MLPGRVTIFREDGTGQVFTVRGGESAASSMRRFFFDRTTDVSGTSGTGPVAEGVQFSDGRVALRWVTSDMPSSTVLYDSIDDAITIHGHGGGTEVVWIDGG